MNVYSRRDMLKSIAGGALGLTALSGMYAYSQEAEKIRPKPNLVLFLSDDHGWNDVGYHGSVIETPNIDSLVREGVELDRYYTYPICGPTRVALMTGRNPITVGVPGNFEKTEPGLDLGEHLLPQSFKAAGYQTFCVGKWHLGGFVDDAYLPHHRGFDYFYGFLSGSTNPYRHTIPADLKPDWQRNGIQITDENGKYCTDLFAAEAVKIIKARDKSRPVFLYLAFHAVHTPLKEPPEPKPVKYENKGVKDKKRQVLAAMVESMDGAIGKVLRAIDEEGMRNDTIVLFMSDNGGSSDKGGASNEPLWGKKGEVWEGGIRVPAAIRWPGVLPKGQVCRQVISAMDWFPTLTAAAGISPGNVRPFDGKNRWEEMRGKKPPTRPEDLVILRGRDAAILDGEWKLVALEEEEHPYLFRIEKDPYEEHDLSSEYPDVTRRLSGKIRAMTARMSQRRKKEEEKTEEREKGHRGEDTNANRVDENIDPEAIPQTNPVE